MALGSQSGKGVRARNSALVGGPFVGVMKQLLTTTLVLSAALSNAQLYGVGASTAGYDFYSINTSTGAATSLFSFNVPGSTHVLGLTYIPSTDRFVTTASFGAFHSKLVEIDLGGASASVVSHGIPLNSSGTPYFEGLEYMSSLGGLVVSYGQGGFYTGQLALLDGTNYGLLNNTSQILSDGDVVFMDGTGALNVMDSNNPTGGFMRNTITSPFGTPVLTGYGLNMFAAIDSDLAWKGDEGRLFLTQGSMLSEVNASSTVITPIGSYGVAGVPVNITGIAAVPEPASLFAVGIGLAALLRRRRKR